MANLTNAQKKVMGKLLELEGAVKGDVNPFASGIDSPSPSFNWTFGNSWLIPDGYWMLLGGPPGGGKSIIATAIEGKMHKDDPDAITIKFNTEMRESVQVTPSQKRLWGVDDERRIVYEVREPAAIFDRIETIIPTLVKEGMKPRLVIIDSISDILGRRQQNAESVNDQQIADKAATIQDGLGRIKSVLRRNKVCVIITSQVRSELDQLEVRRGHKVRFAVSWAAKHSCEYAVMIERYRNKDGRTDLQGNEFVDDTTVGLNGEADEVAHKIRATNVSNSVGRPGRVALFTLHHDLGIINTHEEVFLLGMGMGVIDNSKQGYFGFEGLSWHGKDAMLEVLKGDPELAARIIRECKKKDYSRLE